MDTFRYLKTKYKPIQNVQLFPLNIIIIKYLTQKLNSIGL